MAVVTVRNIPEETHRGLQAQARLSGRSTEAHIRFLLDRAAAPKEELGLGTQIQSIMRKHMGEHWTDEGLVFTRDKTPAILNAAVFE